MSQHFFTQGTTRKTTSLALVILCSLLVGALILCSACTTRTLQNDNAPTANTTDVNTQSEDEPANVLATEVAPDEAILYTLFFGLIDKDTGEQELATEEYRSAIAEIFSEAGVGFTAYEATGAYEREDGTMVQNVTLVFDGIHATDEAISELIEKAQDELNIESVYVETSLRGYGISGGVVNTLE